MIIPKEIKVGKRKIPVSKIKGMKLIRGKYVWDQKIVISDEYTQKQQYETFWHEVTHAILHEMKHPLNRNEKFVTRFAQLLTQAITTAKL